MSHSVTIKKAWNSYIDKYQKEPSDAQHFFQEALNYAQKNGNDNIPFLSCQKVYNANKGIGKIPSSHMVNMPSAEDIDTILDEIEQHEQKTTHPSDESVSKLKDRLKDKCYLFYCPSMQEIAMEIQQKSNGKILLGEIDWQNFKDDFPNLMINKAFNLRYADVVFLADLSDPKNIFEQYALMCAFPRYLAKSVKIFVAYFPTGTMERVEEYGRVATAKTLARLLSTIPTATHGPVQICICDIHTLQNQFYFSDNILIRLETCAGLIAQELQKMKVCSVAFPDEGAQKRFGKIFEKYPQIICTKIRDGDKRIVQLKEGRVKGRNVIIIDDLVQTGGTLADCGELMRGNGCRSVSCFCTHSVFPKESWRRFCKSGKNEGLFETFYVTNTIPTVADVLRKNAPFKILSVASVYLPIICE